MSYHTSSELTLSMNNSDVGLNDVGVVVLETRQDWIWTQVQLKFESKTIFSA